MSCSNERDLIKEEIQLLQIKRMNELALMQNELNNYYNSLLPVQLISNVIVSIAGNAEVIKGILNNLTGFLAGFISKRIVLGKTHNFFTNTIGNIFQFIVAKIVSRKLAENEPIEV